MSFLIADGVLLKYTGADEVVTIPDGVTVIGARAFAGCNSLKEVYLPDGVTTILGGAFQYCTALCKVHLPDSVTDVFGHAFSNCIALEEIRIPHRVKTVKPYVFRHCTALKRVHLPEGLVQIQYGAFERCLALEEIHIPDSVKLIEGLAFYRCKALKRLHLPKEVIVTGYGAFKGCVALADPEGFVVVNGVLYDYSGAAKCLYIPAGVKAIDRNAFYLTNVAPEEVHIYNAEKGMTFNAFSWCSNLKYLVSPETPFAVLKKANLALQAARGFLKYRSLYTTKKISAEYEMYCFSQKKRLLPTFIKADAVEAVAWYAEQGKITKKNFETDYLSHALAAKAVQCTAFLLDWKYKSLPFSDGDEFEV